MSAGAPLPVLRGLCCGLAWLVMWPTVWLVMACRFGAHLVDELVTARLGIAPVLPRLGRWRRRLVIEWRVYRAGVVEGEVMDGVWR